MYGKQNDEKHYQKIATEICKLNNNIVVDVVVQSFPLPDDDPARGRDSGLLLRTKERFQESEFRFGFWVNPFDELWVFRRGWGEGENWEFLDNLQWVKKGIYCGDMFNGDEGFHYRNFARTTAIAFFRNGPLNTPR